MRYLKFIDIFLNTTEIGKKYLVDTENNNKAICRGVINMIFIKISRLYLTRSQFENDYISANIFSVVFFST